MERDRDVEQGVTPCPRARRRGLGSAGGGRRADKLAARVAGLAVVVECAVEAGAAGGARVSRLVVNSLQLHQALYVLKEDFSFSSNSSTTLGASGCSL